MVRAHDGDMFDDKNVREPDHYHTMCLRCNDPHERQMIRDGMLCIGKEFATQREAEEDAIQENAKRYMVDFEFHRYLVMPCYAASVYGD